MKNNIMKFYGICNDPRYDYEHLYLKEVESYSVKQAVYQDNVEEVFLYVNGDWVEIKKDSLQVDVCGCSQV